MSNYYANQTKRNGRILKIVLAVVLVPVLFFCAFYTVSETEACVVTRFGKYISTEGAGPHLKIPGIDEIQKVSTANRVMTIGYNPETNENVLDESKMITGDMNLANVDFYITWRVTDAYRFLYSSSEPEEIFKNIIQAAGRTVIGNEGIDDVLTSGKLQIQADIKDIVIAELAKYELGITLVDIIIQDAEPADNAAGAVNAAFKNVETAKQKQEQMENEGQAYKNRVVPKAQAEADKIVQDATAYKQARIAQAEGEVAEFVAMYAEYQKNPEIVKRRMYLEMIERVFPGLTVYIDTTDGDSMLKILQLEDGAATAE